ncbi:MAG: hypothetical protein RLZZ22_2006 [Pseudomonadota bacterium]|jgi:cytochrome c peroxidase
MTKAHPHARLLALRATLLGLLLAGAAWPALAADTSAAEQLARWNSAASAPGNAERGRIFFAGRHGNELSCASCHQAPPIRDGKHASTGRRIAPLAPAFNPQAFTESAKVDKWFRRNCKDVLTRECTPAEKSDLMAYLVSLKP